MTKNRTTAHNKVLPKAGGGRTSMTLLYLNEFWFFKSTVVLKHPAFGNTQTVMGQTTAFNLNTLKKSVVIMGENRSANEARYIHGEYGKGFWTFYGGHDPEDYQHLVGDPPTELSLHPNSPGYRLILNNILFPAAKKKKQKT
jgi:hypothetical protein